MNTTKEIYKFKCNTCGHRQQGVYHPWERVEAICFNQDRNGNFCLTKMEVNN